MKQIDAIKQIQTILGVEPDGDFRQKSEIALANLRATGPDEEWPPVASSGVAVPVHTGTFNALKKPIGHNHGAPPDSFLWTLIDWAKNEDPAVFAASDAHDIYALMEPVLGPYTSDLHRKAVMCEVLRVLPGDESDWHWNEGRDTTAGPQTPEQMEAGAFQVSYDSRRLGGDLIAFLEAHGIFNAQQFQDKIKADPNLDLAYTARLLREPYKRWDGPLNRGWIAAQVSRDAVAEFQALLA